MAWQNKKNTVLSAHSVFFMGRIYIKIPVYSFIRLYTTGFFCGIRGGQISNRITSILYCVEIGVHAHTQEKENKCLQKM